MTKRLLRLESKVQNREDDVIANTNSSKVRSRLCSNKGMMLVIAPQQGLYLELPVILAAFNTSDLLTDLILIIISFCT